jgi:hypothetical protein
MGKKVSVAIYSIIRFTLFMSTSKNERQKFYEKLLPKSSAIAVFRKIIYVQL